MATVLKEVESGRKIVELPTQKVRMTDRWVEKITTPSSTRATFRDEIVTALYLRVSDKGVKGWSVAYHLAGAGHDGKRGKMQRMTLGGYPLVSLEKARQLARAALEAADRGVDPAALRTAEREARQTRTVEVLFDRFVELHVKQNTKEGRFARDRAAMLDKAREAGTIHLLKGPKQKLGRVAAERIVADNAIPHWRGRLIETITRAEIHDLLDEVIAEDGVALARELRKHLSGFFNWSADRGHLAASPMAGMRRPELSYKARERVLSMEELRRVWDAAGEMGYPFGPTYRALILTGQRRSEIAELERGWVDRERKHFEIPASRYKTGVAHVCPLSGPAWALFEALPNWNAGDCVFTTTGGERPISGFSKAKERIDTLIAERDEKTRARGVDVAPMANWTVHDIRRSVDTHMARLGVLQEHIERVLGHVVQGVAGTYNRYSYLDEKRAALEKWGALWN